MSKYISTFHNTQNVDVPVQRCYDDDDQEVEHPDSLLDQTIRIPDVDEPGEHQAVDGGEPEEKADTSVAPISTF